MSKEEKAKKAKEFWDYLAPIQARGREKLPLSFFTDDDLYIPAGYNPA